MRCSWVLVAAAAMGCAAPLEGGFDGSDPSIAAGQSDDTPATVVDDGPEAEDTGFYGYDEPETEDFHGLDCPVEGSVSWDPEDLCGNDGGCDMVVFSVVCGLIDVYEGELHICLSPTEDGGWTLCADAWADMHGVAKSDVDSDVETDFFEALFEATGVDARFEAKFVPEVDRCVDGGDIGRVVNEVSVTSSGLFVGAYGLDHIACANPHAEGIWGGVAGRGSVSVKVRPECASGLTAAGFGVTTDAAGTFASPQLFLLERVYTGRSMSSLRAPLR